MSDEPEIFPSNDYGAGGYGNEYFDRKKRKIRDEDNDGYDDNWEMKVGLHDAQNKHKMPHLNIGNHLPQYNGIIAIHHDGFKIGPGKNKKISLTIPSPKTMKLNIDLDTPKINMKMKEVKIPKSTMKLIKTPKSSMNITGIENFLNSVFGKKKRKL